MGRAATLLSPEKPLVLVTEVKDRRTMRERGREQMLKEMGFVTNGLKQGARVPGWRLNSRTRRR